MSPLDELKVLDQQIDQIRDLGDLKPIFYRLDELANKHADDFEVQLAASEIKQRVVARGTVLRALGQTLQRNAEAPAAPEPAAEPSSHSATSVFSSPIAPIPTSQIPTYQMPPPPSSESSAPGGPPPLPNRPGGTQDPFPSEAGQPAPVSGGLPPTGSAPPLIPSAALPPPSPPSWKRALLVGGLVGALLAAVLIAYQVKRMRNRTPANVTVPLAIVTVPDGASVRINGEPKCTSNCSVAIQPGEYQVTAFLDGYEPAAGNVNVTAKQPAELSLTLAPEAQTVRILTDSPQGKIVVDDQPPADLQDGQFVINKIPVGTHTVKVSSKSGEVSFSLEIANAAMPKITGTVDAKDLTAILVSSLGDRARVVTNTPSKLAVNKQAQGDAGPQGVDVTGFHPGVQEFTVGDGKDQRTMTDTFGPSPTLTVFLKSDVSTGTLIITASEDDARVFLSGKEYARRTKKGELRMPALGTVNVRVAKDGFEVAPPQTAEVKKGAETRLTFKLQPIPRVATLQLRGAIPGAEVSIDQKSVGTVADDGTLTVNAVQPGDHVIDIRKDQFTPRRLQRPFVAGQTVSLSGLEVTLASAVGTVRVARVPADAAIAYRRADETQSHDLRGNQLDLAPGAYIFTARAPGFVDRTERVQLALGETHPVDLTLTRTAAPPPPAPKVAGMSDFEDPSAWTKQGDFWAHKGAGFIPFKLPANGTFTFNIRLLKGGSLFRGGKIRWAVQYVDGKNYDLFELDRKSLASKVFEAGKPADRGKFDHGLPDKEMSYNLQIEVSSGQLIHRIQNGDNWVVLDTWKEPGRNFSEGKFGFLVQGNDEIGIADFKFVPK